MSTKDLEWELWTPHWSYERVSDKRCRANVADGGRSVGFHQCCNKPVETVGGYGWCKRHAKRAKERLAQ